MIVDDEFWARENLRGLLTEHPQIEVIGEAPTVEETQRTVVESKPDVVFLNIERPFSPAGGGMSRKRHYTVRSRGIILYKSS